MSTLALSMLSYGQLDVDFGALTLLKNRVAVHAVRKSGCVTSVPKRPRVARPVTVVAVTVGYG